MSCSSWNVIPAAHHSRPQDTRRTEWWGMHRDLSNASQVEVWKLTVGKRLCALCRVRMCNGSVVRASSSLRAAHITSAVRQLFSSPVTRYKRMKPEEIYYSDIWSRPPIVARIRPLPLSRRWNEDGWHEAGRGIIWQRVGQSGSSHFPIMYTPLET